jgi:hypothetical protein
VAVGRVLFEDLAREVVEGLATEADRVFLDVPADLPVLHTDRQLLGRVVTNVLDNALKYFPDASPVELGASATPHELTFWVRDHGIGITPEQERRIFERFYQADSSTTRGFRGAGLGLSMVHDLLGHLGGRSRCRARHAPEAPSRSGCRSRSRSHSRAEAFDFRQVTSRARNVTAASVIFRQVTSRARNVTAASVINAAIHVAIVAAE